MGKDAYYFTHDANARHDPNICDMRTVYGSEGYGWYWMLIEMMREQGNYMLPLCKCNAYAMQMQCDKNAVEKFINSCVNDFNLFQSDGKHFWSNSLIRRMKQKEEKSQKARQAAVSRWGSERNADAMQTQCERNALKESKVNKSKVKKNTVPKIPYSEFVLLTEAEYERLITEFGEPKTKRLIEILDNYIGQNPEKNKKKYTDHNRVLRNWVLKRFDEEQQKGGGQAAAHRASTQPNYDPPGWEDNFFTKPV